MKKQLRIFLSGVMVVAPFAVTAYAILWVGKTVDGLVRGGLGSFCPIFKDWWLPGAGVISAFVGVYVIGLLTRLWAFRWALRMVERLFSRMPGVKTVYESVRDVLKVFGGEANQMGQAVRYRLPGTEVDLLGIRTSTSPSLGGQGDKVAVYLPMSYQFGGLTVYVRPESVEPIEMSVEEALKVAATAGASPAHQKEQARRA